MCKVITVSNQKGGTAKTTSCVNLGIGLASAGKKVLLIDTDPQGSLSISLGYPEPDAMEKTLATLMMNIVNDEEFCLEDVMLHHEEVVVDSIEFKSVFLTPSDSIRQSFADTAGPKDELIAIGFPFFKIIDKCLIGFTAIGPFTKT